MSADIDDQTRHNILYRLRWTVLDSLSHIEIATGPTKQVIILPLLTHALANESLFNPPLSIIDAINIRDFIDKRDREMYYSEEDRYKPPPPLRIDNLDGSPVTLGQFVSEVHVYVREHVEELRRVNGEMCGEAVSHADGSRGRKITAGRPVAIPDIWFDHVMPVRRDGSVGLLVML